MVSKRTMDKGKGFKMASGAKSTSASGVTSRAISKKRAQKDQRNAKYTKQMIEARNQAIDGDLVMQDMDNEQTLSSTQKKIRDRKLKQQQQNAIKLNIQSDMPEQEMMMTSSGEGTTLGQPPKR